MSVSAMLGLNKPVKVTSETQCKSACFWLLSNADLDICMKEGAPQGCIGLLQKMHDKAYQTFNAGAYLHQYQDFDTNKQDSDTCFARTEEIFAACQVL